MKKWENLNLLIESGLVAVIRRPKPEHIESVVDSLVCGGVGALEITVDTPDAFHLIQTIKRQFGDRALVGAGTVLDAETAKTAIDADGDFIFSPILDAKTVELTNRIWQNLDSRRNDAYRKCPSLSSRCRHNQSFPCKLLGGELF